MPTTLALLFCVSLQPASLRTGSGSMSGTMLSAAQFVLLQKFAAWWVAPPWPTLSVAAVLLALCRLLEKTARFGNLLNLGVILRKRTARPDRVPFGLCQFGCRCTAAASEGRSVPGLNPLAQGDGGG